ncbi:Ni/Fe hydrogenase subunit alpha [Candidatus Bipolaricaulota bacterium]|nr:Ni/Fe hydrogenase subunit alpha [Candidatus Bipolaricaulota bacterium]
MKEIKVPVTRIEGHGLITLRLDRGGKVAAAKFHVTEARGFERFCQGRTVWEMPGITARICGICPVSHLLCSAKAGDAILAVRPPRPAEVLRRLMNLGQFIQSHALSFFHLSSPDLLLGWDADPKGRNVFGLAQAHPQLALDGIRLRAFGQEIIAALGEKRVHPAWAVPGGVRQPLSPEARDRLAAKVPEARRIAQDALALYEARLPEWGEEIETFGNFPSLFMALVASDGTWEHHAGRIRFVDADRRVVADGLDPARYPEYIGEAVEGWSYLKFPYFQDAGYPEGLYRVGPLSRLNCCDRMGTPLADEALARFRAQADGKAVTSSFHYHYARLIETLAAVEQVARLLEDPEVLSPRVRAEAGINELEGVGVHEAPRGTLFHHYWVDEHGVIQRVNLIVSTGHNNLAMNRTVAQIAARYLTGRKVSDGLLNRLEGGIRAYDPCLSCSVHAVGRMPLRVVLVGPTGEVLDERTRDA